MPHERVDRVRQHAREFVAPPMGHVSLLLRSNSGWVPLAGKAYRIRIHSERILEGTTDDEGLVSHDEVPVGEYAMELEGFEGEITVPSIPTDEERQVLRIADYMLFTDDEPEDEAAFPDYESMEVVLLGDIDDLDDSNERNGEPSGGETGGLG